MSSAKKYKKTIEWEEISSGNLEISKEYLWTMGMIKDKNGRNLTEVEEIKKRWQEYTEELYKKTDLNIIDNHNGVVTDLKPYITENEFKWA